MGASSLENVVNYATSSNFSFDSSLIEFSGGKAKLKLQTANEEFTEDFADDTGFTYDSDLSEFVAGLLRQKDQRPADATFFASYNTSLNGDWGAGVLTATNTGGVLNAGKLELLGGISSKYVDYDADLNADSQQTGCVRMKITPNYSGTPPVSQIFFRAGNNGNNNNAVGFQHMATGQIALRVFNASSGGIIVTDIGAWSPVAGTEYEFEFNWDITTGATRLFIDGVQLGSTIVSTGTRSGAITLIRVGEATTLGSNLYADFSVNSLLIFSTIQHTVDYTPGDDPASFVYVETSADLPAFEHALLGTFLSYTSMTTTETASPRYSVKTGAGAFKYWNGSSWVASNGTYAQANSKADINSNLATLTDASGASSVTLRVHFQGSSTQSSIDELAFNVSAHTQYPTSDPALTPNSSIEADALESFAETSSVVTGSDDIRYTLCVNSQDKYWNGSAWVNSNGTYAQANTPDEINTNASSLDISAGVSLKVKAFLHSDDGQSTPEIETVTMGYNFFNSLGDPATCTVWGFYRDLSGEGVSGATVTVALKRMAGQYREAGDSIVEKAVTRTTDSNGRFEMDLIRSSEFEGGGSYTLTIKNPSVSPKLDTSVISGSTAIEFTVPDSSNANIAGLITAVE